MNYYRQAPIQQSRFFPFFGAPLIGGFFGGLLGSALFRPRPFYPYPYAQPPYPPYPPYGGYGGYVGYGGYGPGPY